MDNAMFRHACAMGPRLEEDHGGYKSGACKCWLKVKNPVYERRTGV